jgi:enhancing lycopene biosynthesis protein 2
MALTKTTENDKIEVVRKWNIQVRTATVIKEDGTEIGHSFHRAVLVPGTLDASDNLVDTNISGEDADVQAICNAAWTTTVKNEFKAHLIAIKPSQT